MDPIALLDRYGMPHVSHRDADHEYPWDGEALDISAVTGSGSSPIEGLTHELAHWLLATKRRRRQYNYGLGDLGVGTGPWSDREEAKASLLGIAFLIKLGSLGKNGPVWIEAWQDHGWCHVDGYNPFVVIKKIRHLLPKGTAKTIMFAAVMEVVGPKQRLKSEIGYRE